MYTQDVDHIEISSKSPEMAGYDEIQYKYLGAPYDYLGAQYDYGQDVPYDYGQITPDFLGICLGGKKCQERKKHRQEQRRIRREARTARVVARTQSEITNPGSTGIGATLGNLVGGLFGGGSQDSAPMMPETTTDADLAALELQQRQEDAKKKANMNKVIIVVLVLIVLGALWQSRTKKKA